MLALSHAVFDKINIGPYACDAQCKGIATFPYCMPMESQSPLKKSIKLDGLCNDHAIFFLIGIVFHPCRNILR